MKERSSGDDHLFLLLVVDGQGVITRVRTIIYVVSMSPPVDGHIAHAKRSANTGPEMSAGTAWILAWILGVVVACL